LWWLFLHRRLRFGNEAQLSLSNICSLRRVLASGSHSFLFERLEKVSQLSLAEPFGSDKGVIELTAACLFSRSGVTAPIADPFFGLEGRNLRDGSFILLCTFQIKFLGVFF
jgi:hypothetical protein